MLNQSKFPKNIFLGGKQIFQVEFSKTINLCFFLYETKHFPCKKTCKQISRLLCTHITLHCMPVYHNRSLALSIWRKRPLRSNMASQFTSPILLIHVSQTSAVQYWSWIRSADLHSSNVVLKWLDECVFEQRFMVFENSHWKLIFSPKKLFIEILIGLTFLITSNYLKSALLYSDLVSVFGIALDFCIL